MGYPLTKVLIGKNEGGHNHGGKVIWDDRSVEGRDLYLLANKGVLGIKGLGKQHIIIEVDNSVQRALGSYGGTILGWLICEDRLVFGRDDVVLVYQGQLGVRGIEPGRRLPRVTRKIFLTQGA